MKRQNNFLKTVLLAVALLAGSSTVWADNVNIPQDLGSYISWASGTKDAGDGTVQTDPTDLGSTNGSTQYSFTLNNNSGSAQDFYFSFGSGAIGLTAKVSFTLAQAGSSYSVKKEFDISNTGAWTTNEMHYAVFESVPTGDLTLTFKVENTTGSYGGNFGKMSFNTISQIPSWPTDGSSNIDLSKGVYYNSQYNSGSSDVSHTKNGGFMDNIILNNTTAGYYQLKLNVSNKSNDGSVKMTVYDVATGAKEAENTMSVASTGDKYVPFASNITTGVKRIRFDFVRTDASYILNYKEVTLSAITFADVFPALPLTGTATLNLNQSTALFCNSSYESGDSKNNIGNVKGTSPYVDGYYANNTNETAYYDLFANISWYKSEGTLKVTVTDLSTNTEEATGTSSSITATGDIHFSLNNAITPGAKRIRFDFVSGTTNDYLYNVKNVSFYKRSLNEGYDYTPVAATGVDVVLTRSITADKWSTIVLPFAMTSAQLTATFGSDVKVAELTSGTASTLNFSTVTETAANKPYAIKVTSNFTSATINGVTIVEGTPGTPTQTITNWQFVGTYSNGTIAAGDNYYFKSNQLYQAGGSGTTSIKPFRAYLHYTGSDPAPAPTFTIDGNVTGIAQISAAGQMNLEEGAFYNLSGQRVANPTKGLYIVNGRKVVIK